MPFCRQAYNFPRDLLCGLVVGTFPTGPAPPPASSSGIAHDSPQSASLLPALLLLQELWLLPLLQSGNNRRGILWNKRLYFLGIKASFLSTVTMAEDLPSATHQNRVIFVRVRGIEDIGLGWPSGSSCHTVAGEHPARSGISLLLGPSCQGFLHTCKMHSSTLDDKQLGKFSILVNVSIIQYPETSISFHKLIFINNPNHSKSFYPPELQLLLSD